MADLTRYINSASSAGGDGTTNGTEGATRAWVSITEFEAEVDKDLTGDTLTVYLTGDHTPPTGTYWDIDGWTQPGSSNWLKIAGEPSNKHSGTAASGAKITANASQSYIIVCRELYVRFEDLLFDGNSCDSVAIRLGHAVSGATENRVDRCLLYNSGDDGINTTSAATGVVIQNSIIYECSGQGIHVTDAAGSMTCLNVTVADCNVGYRTQNASAVMVCTNCLGADSGVTDFLQTSGTLTDSYCCSEDSSAVGTGSRNNAITFENQTSDDYHLDAADSGGRTYGTDLSGTFTDDIDGAGNRVGVSDWDMGAHQVTAAAGGGSEVPLMYSRRSSQ